MRKIIFGILFISLLSFNCKKNNDGLNNDGLNISLHDTSLSVIQKYIQGNWKLQYEEGGICGNCTFYPTDKTFNLNMALTPERIKLRNANFETLDTTITWSYVNIFGDSTYALNFRDSAGIPFTFAADGIYNDTLLLYQPGPDGMSFYYIKSN